ncbi:unnamed protein product, partial [Polarella glacialis]
ELQLLGAPGAPPRRALLGPWWRAAAAEAEGAAPQAGGGGFCASSRLPSYPLVPSCSQLPPAATTLTALLPFLPPWAAAALGLPASPVRLEASKAKFDPALDIREQLEGLWCGFAAATEVGPHHPAQPLR